MARTPGNIYNEELKQAFIDDSIQSENSKKNAVIAFRTISKYEEAWGADFCTRTAEEIRPVMEEICGARARSKYTRLGLFSNYSRWCVQHGIPGAIDNTIQPSELGNTKLDSLIIRNPEHLQRCLDEYFEPESEETVDNTYRCFFWLAYGGMAESDIIQTAAPDVDFENMIVHHGDSVAVIYRQALPAIRNCIRLTQFRYKHPNYEPIWKDRIPGPELIRGTRGSKITEPGIRSMLSRRITQRAKDGSIMLSYQRVWRSGMFYRIYEQELAGTKPNFHIVALNSPLGRKVTSSNLKTDKKARLRQIASDLKTDYTIWKKAIQI